MTPPEPLVSLLGQDFQLRSHLKRSIVLVAVAAIVVVTHQTFVLMNYPSGGWHSLAHVALVIIAVALIFAAWIIWSSYLRLQCSQQCMIDAYAQSEIHAQQTGTSLRKSESLLESLFGAITDRILVVDQGNRIIKANAIAATWAGRDPTSLRFDEVYPDCDSHGERRNELALIEFTRATQKPQRGRLLRGGVACARLLSIDTYPVNPRDHESTVIISIARDVTEQTGRELVSRHREKMATLGLLVAGFAHDLGNPLASLSSELELLHEENDPDKVRESLDTINGYLERIRRKLHEIVEFARHTDRNRQDVDTREAIDHALKLTRHDPRARRIRFKVDVADDVLRVQMQEDDLVLALVNLIINAFDAMPQGGTLSFSTSMSSSGDVLLTVLDTGAGMDAATLHQATRPLFTTKATCDTDGTGLGLTMVEQLIGVAGGEITLSSEVGHGTCVTLRLPASETD